MKGGFWGWIFFFGKSDSFFSVNHRFFTFTGFRKTKEDDVPQNECEKDVAIGPIEGNVIVCFVNKTKDNLFFAVEWGYFLLLNQGTFDFSGAFSGAPRARSPTAK